MSAFRNLILLSLLLPFLAMACTLEQICKDEGTFECLKGDKGSVSYRVCRNGNWAEESCRATEICQVDACVSLDTLCATTGTQCLDLKSVETCTQFSKAETKTCEAGAYCNADACASGKECCVVGEICNASDKTCLNDDTLMICVKDERPSEQLCGLEKHCDAGACVYKVCSNGRLDAGEEAVDCGGGCAPCVACRVDTDCGENGFCDSASGYLCSKRCRTNNDCANSDIWDGQYCRGDGRCSPKVFETAWALTEEELTVVLPFDPEYPNAKCDFQVLWGDEPEGSDITARPHVTNCEDIENRTHKYLEAGSYSVKIIGTYDGWGAFDKINHVIDPEDGTLVAIGAKKLIAVRSFGPVGLSSRAFFACEKLHAVPKKDIPDASKLKDLSYTFRLAISFNDALVHWDLSNVTNIGWMFSAAYEFNQDIRAWDTSKATDMSWMFSYAYDFNQPLDAWDTSHVEDMSAMFNHADAFDKPIGEWDTSRVKDMSEMFAFAKAFNQDLAGWNTGKVSSMQQMFDTATAFNKPVNAWDTSKVTNMAAMFSFAEAFNQPLDAWDTSQVVNMSKMFYGATVFDKAIGLWNTENVVDMQQMFNLAKAFNQAIGTWNTRNVTHMNSMFASTGSFNQAIGVWNTGNVTDMSGMFSSAVVFNKTIGAWNTTNVTDMSSMFLSASAFNQPITGWSTSKVTNMSDMFASASVFNQSLGSWDTRNVTDMSRMFSFALAFDQSLLTWRLNAAVTLKNMFSSSGISRDQLCALHAKGGAWLTQWEFLGAEFVCK